MKNSKLFIRQSRVSSWTHRACPMLCREF